MREGRKKEASKVNKAKQHSTPEAVNMYNMYMYIDVPLTLM